MIRFHVFFLFEAETVKRMDGYTIPVNLAIDSRFQFRHFLLALIDQHLKFPHRSDHNAENRDQHDTRGCDGEDFRRQRAVTVKKCVHSLANCSRLSFAGV